MTTPASHKKCRADIADFWGAQGVEVIISTAPPLVPNIWTESMTCPHGTAFYWEPTNEQKIRWKEEGVR